MMEQGYSQGPVLRRPAEQELSFRGQIFFLAAGLLPLGMLLQFWLRSGTGLHLGLVGYMFVLAGSFLVALNYHLFYRQYRPRSALVSASIGKGLLVAALLMPIGAYNMLATAVGIGLTLSPGPRLESGQQIQVAAKVIGQALSPGLMRPLKLPPRKNLDLSRQAWLINRPYMGGALWGALGYGIPFGIAAMCFGFLRKEILDPRDEHIGSGAMGGLVRGMVGLYYGTSVGFTTGALLIFVLRTMLPTVTQATPNALLHWVYVLGAASNPNVAFTYAFSTASVLCAAMALFSGRRDFTASISDPKAPELTRPIEIMIPEVPPAPGMGFDMGRVQQESQQILQQFGSELNRVLGGSEWEYERYDLPPIGRGGKKPEAEATNVISSREPDEDDGEFNAMGSLSNVYVQIVADLGKLEISAADWLTMAEGAILELPKAPDNAINVSINGKPAGKGRALTINGNKAVKMVQLRAQVEQLIKT